MKTHPSNISSGERAKAEAAYTLAAYNYPKDPVGSRDWTLYYGGWLHRAALATQPAESKACASVGVERDQLRAEQSANVMPQIGPLLDAWEGLDNDTKSILREQSPGLDRCIRSINRAMEGAALASPAPSVGHSIAIDFKQATELLEMFGGDAGEITLTVADGTAGNGIYAHYTDYPEEGSEFLGVSDGDATPPAAPAAPSVGEPATSVSPASAQHEATQGPADRTSPTRQE